MKKILALTALAAIVASPASAVSLIKNDQLSVDLKGSLKSNLLSLSKTQYIGVEKAINDGLKYKTSLSKKASNLALNDKSLEVISTYALNSDLSVSYSVKLSGKDSAKLSSSQFLTIKSAQYGSFKVGQFSLSSLRSGLGDFRGNSLNSRLYGQFSDLKPNLNQGSELLSLVNINNAVDRGIQFNSNTVNGFTYAVGFGKTVLENNYLKKDKYSTASKLSTGIKYEIQDSKILANFIHYDTNTTLKQGDTIVINYKTNGLGVGIEQKIDDNLSLEANVSKTVLKNKSVKKFKEKDGSFIESINADSLPSSTLNHIGASAKYVVTPELTAKLTLARNILSAVNNNKNEADKTKAIDGIFGKEVFAKAELNYVFTKNVTLNISASQTKSKYHVGNQTANKVRYVNKALASSISLSF